MNNTMKNFIYTTIGLCIVTVVLIINCVRLQNRINQLEDCVEQVYTELQYHQYMTCEYCTEEDMPL